MFRNSTELGWHFVIVLKSKFYVKATLERQKGLMNFRTLIDAYSIILRSKTLKALNR